MQRCRALALGPVAAWASYRGLWFGRSDGKRSFDAGRRHLRVFVLAGEPSGDALGAAVMHALRASAGVGAGSGGGHGAAGGPGVRPRHGDLDAQAVEFHGVGGPLMRKAGLQAVFDAEDLAVMGLWELIPHLPRLYARLQDAKRAVREIKPDILLTIDSKGFNFRLLRQLQRTAAPRPWTTAHLVAPSVWAYKGDHSKTLQFLGDTLDLLLVLWPCEEPIFSRHVSTVCVGHPVLDLPQVWACLPGLHARTEQCCPWRNRRWYLTAAFAAHRTCSRYLYW